MSIYNSDQNLWMHKYRYTLQRLENEEKEWRKKEGILKLIATWLILAADQNDEQLNSNLQELRVTLRSNEKSHTLQSMADKLGANVTRMSKERKGKSVNRCCINLFVQVLDSLEPSLEEVPDNEALIGTLTQSLQSEGKIAFIETCVSIFSRHFQSHLGAGQKQQQNAAQMGFAADSISENMPRLHEVFIRLIHMLELPHQLSAQADVIIERMKQGIEADQVNFYTNEIVDLALQARLLVQAEKQEMGRFLKVLSDQLSDMDNYLITQEVSEREIKELREQLSDNLDEEVCVIGTTLLEASDLDTIKSAIQARLDTIHDHLEQGRRAEAKRAEKAEAENRRLQVQLKAAENVTAELIEKLYRERELAIRDPLTGLYNRIAYEERIQEEVKRWHGYKRPLSLIIIDIDRFKQVNDGYGHRTGDRLLRFLGEVIQSQIRETDVLVRFGGEEFVVVASDTSRENAHVLAEKLRVAVNQCNFHFGNERIPVTVSCGISSLMDEDTPEKLFERADKALYKAKKEGRNLCIAA